MTTWFDGLLDRAIRPGPLLAGVVVGFAACAWLGHAVGATNRFKNFERFTVHTDPQSNYQPSANQVRSLMRESVRRDQIAVVVAGDSVLFGSGQGREGAWTKRLQEELGDRYRVINLALPGLHPQEFGTVAAEMLYRDGHQRVIVLTHNWISPIGALGAPDGRPLSRWFFWDAFSRRRLLDDPARAAQLAPAARGEEAQDPVLREQIRKDREQREEVQRQITLDRWLNFRDLWNGFEYEYGVTVWCKVMGETWYQPRKSYPDPDPVHPAATPAVLEVAKVHIVQNYQPQIATLRPVVRRPSGEVLAPGELGGPFPIEESLRNVFPAPIRERMIVVATHFHPQFLEALTPDERITWDALGPAMAAIYARSGVTVFEACKGYPYDAYFDYAHMTVAGGRRLAADLAPAVRRLAAKLGYLEETNP